jgi:hypothetical protein
MPLFAPNIQKLQAKLDVTGLVEALAWPRDVKVRYAAQEALAQVAFEEHCGKVPFEVFTTALRHEDPVTRLWAVKTLGKIGVTFAKEVKENGINLRILAPMGSITDKYAIDKFTSFGRDNMADIGDNPAVAPLINALGDKEWKIFEAACDFLGEIGDQQAIPALIAVLGGKDEVNRLWAADNLGKIGGGQVVKPLLIAMHDRFDNVRTAAKVSLYKLTHPQEIEIFIQLLSDPDKRIRRDSADHLLYMGCYGHDMNKAGIPLVSLLNDSEAEVRVKAAEALGYIDYRNAYDKLKLVAEKDPDEKVRQAAADAVLRLDHLDEVNESRAQYLDEEYRGKHMDHVSTMEWDRQDERIRELGEKIYREGGEELLNKVIKRVKAIGRSRGHEYPIEKAWSNIGK